MKNNLNKQAESNVKKFEKIEKRAAELIIANKDIALQTAEKDNLATGFIAELIHENKELVSQTEEAVDRATEADSVNKTLALQNEELLSMSYHDKLTGLYNRRFYEEALARLDKTKTLPYTIIIGDINGLKLINDSFGYDKGDELLKQTAHILKAGCRAKDIIARLSGDEFVILLPKTNSLEAARVLKRIYALALKEKTGPIDISISFGYETKIDEGENSLDIFKKAEDFMYEHKTYARTSTRSKIIDLIMNTLYEKSNRELQHSQRVSEICGAIAAKMNFNIDDINQMKIAGLMHDIGKIGISEEILNKPEKLTVDEWSEMKRHPEIGFRILSSDDKFSKIASYVIEHHEYFDGNGYPKGLKGEEISVQAKIISIADAFDAMTAKRTYCQAVSEDKAINEIIKCSGSQFDTNIAKIFVEKVLRKAWRHL